MTQDQSNHIAEKSSSVRKQSEDFTKSKLSDKEEIKLDEKPKMSSLFVKRKVSQRMSSLGFSLSGGNMKTRIEISTDCKPT